MSETIEQKCIAKGVKLTEQRKIIAKVMSEATDHPDVNELYNRVSKIDVKGHKGLIAFFFGGDFSETTNEHLKVDFSFLCAPPNQKFQIFLCCSFINMISIPCLCSTFGSG